MTGDFLRIGVTLSSGITFVKMFEGLDILLPAAEKSSGVSDGIFLARVEGVEMTGMLLKTLHLAIHGRVQGVYFRNSMQEEAERLGVSGWVRNLPDRSVEAMVQGEADAVDAIVRWAQRGPMMASVERVDTSPGSGSYAGFEIR